MMFRNKKRGNVAIAISIIVAGLIIAAAVVFTDNGAKLDGGNENPADRIAGAGEDLSEILSPITEVDHYRGDLNAPIKVVEFSDTECPFCKNLHETLKTVMPEYEGKVVWVYRHLPLAQLHPRAVAEAQATECVAELAGEEVFWNYLNKIYAETPANNKLDPALLPQWAAEMGVDRAAFESCLSSGKYAEKVNAMVKEGFALGAEGTPFSVIITPDGQYIPVAGAQPIEVWRNIFDAILLQAESDNGAAGTMEEGSMEAQNADGAEAAAQ